MNGEELMTDDNAGAVMDNVIRIDEGRIKDQLGEMVRGTVEEALNAMLDAEADRFVEHRDMSTVKIVKTRVRAIMSDRFTPRQAKLS